MTEFSWIERITPGNEWATILFVATLGVIVVTRTVFETRFADFTRLIVNDKYLKIYRDHTQISSWFNVLLFWVQLITYSFLLLIWMDHLGWMKKENFKSFIQIFTLFSFFILSKYLIEKIIATTFDIEEKLDQFNLYKISYRAFSGLIMFPFAIVMYYNETLNISIFFVIVILIALAHLFTYLKTLKSFQTVIINNLFYFILYLCALEIGPYYFIYYWFINK
jgi:hypothetical protein